MTGHPPIEVAVGVDIGTSSAKAVVFTLAGDVLSQHGVATPVQRPEAGAAEHDPDAVVEAVLESIGHALGAAAVEPGCIACVSFSAAMHSLIALDAGGVPLTGSLTWADNRAAGASERLRARVGTRLYERTGTPMHPMSPLAKLAWLREERPALHARAARFVGIKEYVLFRLFGVWVVDHSVASATGLWNMATLDWDDEALREAGVTAGQLSALVPATHALRGLPAPLAERLGVEPDTPFIVGGNDGALSSLGAGATRRGDLVVSMGTSGAVRAVVEAPVVDAAARTFCYALVPGYWVIGGPVNNGGSVFQWMKSLFAEGGAQAPSSDTSADLSSDALMRLAASVPPGAEGLLFHPYLEGERAPTWNANLRGSFFGLAIHHRRAHLVRAVFEGVIFNLLGLLPGVEALVETSASVTAVGGFLQSPLWLQMLADMFVKDVVVPPAHVDGSCRGAATLGLAAVGRLSSLDAARGLLGPTRTLRPDRSASAVYARLFGIFSALPGRLEDPYRQIAAFQREVGRKV